MGEARQPCLGPRINRRSLLVGAAAGGGLLIAWNLLPRRYPAPLAAGKGETGFDAWLAIGEDGMVRVAIPQLEMGQGASTLVAQVVAMELGADWRLVAAQPAPVSEIWANVPLASRWSELWMPVAPSLAVDGGWLTRRWAEAHRFMATADGTTLAAYEMPARVAGASARAMLAMAAARRWGVRWEECEVAGGMVRHGSRKLSFGRLAGDAVDFTPPDPPVLRSEPPAENPGDFPAGSTPRFPRLELPAMADGSWQFAGDVRLPGMVYAAIRHAPVGGAELASFDGGKARGLAGFLGLVKGPAGGDPWLAAVAENWWAAERALGLIAPRFVVHGPVDTLEVEAALEQALRTGAAHRLAEAGDAAEALGNRPAFTARYDVSAAVHAPLETASATVRLRDGRAELWLASQMPEMARRAVALALGLSVRDVILYPMPAGGSFDARLEHAHAVEAALISREVGRPVQLTWSRWQEMLASPMRPPVAAEIAARLDASGKLMAWRLRAAMPASAREFGARAFGGASRTDGAAQAGDHADPLALEGAVPPYGVPNFVIEQVPTRIGLPTGRMRGNAHGYTAFFTECAIDELAASLHHEPLSFRMAMLEGDPRLAQCLQRVSALAGWNGGADGSGAGLACHRMGSLEGGGCIAAIASARRDANGVRVDRVSVVADIGRIVNVDMARQQIEGGLVFGIGLATGCAPGHARGLPANGRLALLGLPLLADCPEIEVEFIGSSADPFDPGELGVAVAAPAIANALFSATGLRFRKLPLIADEI